MSARKTRVDGGRPARRLSSVRGVGDERAYLYRLIETIGSGPDLETILRGVVRLVTEATECHACLVWFVQDGRLVLRSASPPYEHLHGSVSMGLDEGLGGWVVRTRRSASIEQDALSDPRVKYFPEFEEDRYQSLVSVPIFSRGGEVIGVINLQAVAPHEFGRTDLDLLDHTASLIGGAVENARLYEDATARVSLLSELSRLSQAIASSATEPEVLRVVTQGVRDLLGAPRVEIHLVSAEGVLVPAATLADSRDRNRQAAAPWVFELEAVSPAAEPGSPVRRPWVRDPPDDLALEPLVAGTERLGILAASLPERSVGAEAALASIAAHTAVAIKQHRAIERLTEENLVKDLFSSLSHPEGRPEETAELARRLGCDLDRPHVVLHVTGWTGTARGRGRVRNGRASWSEVLGQLRSRLTTRFPGVLIDGLERSLRALVPCGETTPEEVLDRVRDMDTAALGTGLSVGVSSPSFDARSYPRAFAEAESAAEVGGLLRGVPGVTTYEELGPYRYVLGAEDDARDPIQQRLELLAEYDGRRGTQLLETLEGYLDRRGSVAATSRDLFVHANTLRQRLDRIQRVSGIDLERDDWLSLAVATKVVKLRRMRRSAGPEGRNDG